MDGSRRLRHRALVLAAITVTVAGCSVGTLDPKREGFPCNAGGTCENGLVCYQGKCVLPEHVTGDGGVTDAGSTDGGVTDAGSTDGGVTDAGSTDAGVADGGGTDAGVADGGSTDAGVTDGGSADGGAPPAAFPGAEGGGAMSAGGRGGEVYIVNSLADDLGSGCGPGGSGTCTLRACVEASGPRTCVFAVAGTITLGATLDVANPYLTIAGQTAPGGGIALSGVNLIVKVINVGTHDVVIRYLRVRKGYNSAGTGSGQSGHTLSIVQGAYDVIVDHCSLTWTQDNNVYIGNSSAPAAHAVTLSWDLVAEPLSSHPTDALATSSDPATAAQSTDIDWHHDLFASSDFRVPLLMNGSSRFVNNVVYNWGYYATMTNGGVQADFIGNLYKVGPQTSAAGTFASTEIRAGVEGCAGCGPAGSPSLYLCGNEGPNDAQATPDDCTNAPGVTTNWQMTEEVNGQPNVDQGPIPDNWKRTSPLAPGEGLPITAEPASAVENDVLAGVGASMKLDDTTCKGDMVPARDSADARIVGDVSGGSAGTWPTDETAVGGFPQLAAGTPCADADGDGMPDVWESYWAGQLGRTNLAPTATDFGDGYTNLEHYLDGMSPVP